MVGILLVSTDIAQQDKIAGFLAESGYQVELVATEIAALAWLAETSRSPRLLLIDYFPSSLVLIRQLKANDPTVELILLADPQERLNVAALQAGAYACLAKPVDLIELELIVRRTVEYSRWREQAAERQELIRAAERRAHQLEVLHQINSHISSALNLDTILQITLKEGLAAVRTDTGSIMLLNPVTEELEIRAWLLDGKFVHHRPHPQLRLGEGVAGHVAVTGESYNCLDSAQDPRCFHLEEGLNTGSILSVPIISYGRVLGTINADSRTPSFFSSDDMKFLAALAGHVAIAIESQRLRDVTAISSMLLPLEEMLAQIGEHACLLFGAESVTLSLWDPELLRPVQVVRFPTVLENELNLREKGLTQMVATSGEPLVIPDAQNDPQVKPALKARGIKFILGVPLRVVAKDETGSHCRTIGTLFVNVKYRDYSQRDFELVTSLAGQIAIALENARLYSREADKLRRVELLAHAGGEIMGDLAGLSLDERLHLIAKHATEILEVEACGISLVKHPGFLSFAAGYGYRPGCLQLGQEFAIHNVPGGGLTGYIAYQGELFNMHGDQLSHHHAYAGSPSCTISGHCYSLLAIPLKRQTGRKADLIGLLRVDNKKDKTGRVGPYLGFNREDEWIIQLFADAAVVAIEGAKLFHSTEIARERLNLLYEEVRKARNTAKVVAEVTTLENVDNTLRSVAVGTYEALNCDAVSLYGYNPIKASLTYPPTLVGVRFPEKASSRTRLPSDHIALEILKGDRLYRVDDVATDPLFKDTRFAREEEIVSCVGIPLKVGAEKVGVMFVNYRSPHQFTSEELVNFELFAHQAAVAIRNASLYRQTQQQARQMATLVEISRIINTSLDLDTALTTILNSIKPLINYTAAEICLWNDQAQAMLVYGQAGDSRYTEQAKRKYGLAEGYTGWIAQHWEPLLIKDVTEPGAVQPKVLDPDKPIRSFLGVPLQVGHDRLGTLELVSDCPDAFSEEDQKLLDIIAQHALIAIKNARLFEAEQSRAEHLAALHQVAMAANSTLDISEIFRRVLIEMLKVFNLDRGGVTLFDEEGGYGYTLIEYPEQAHASTALMVIPLTDNPLVEALVTQKQPLGFQDVLTDPRLNRIRPLVQHWRVKSMLAVPLVVKDKVLGMISLASSQAHRAFTPRDMTLAQTIINQVATAIENAQLYEQEQRRIRVLQALYEASRVLVSSFELEEILNNIAQQAWRLTIYRAKKISFASIKLVENMQTKLVAIYPREASPKIQAAVAPERNGPGGIVGRAIKTGLPQLVDDVTTDPDYQAVHPQTRSELAVPIKIGYQIVGAINVEHPDYHAFDREDQYALESLAAQAAIAIQNARLFKETERYARLLDAAAKVARGATRILDKAQLLNRAVELIVERFHFLDYAGVFLLDEKHEVALLQAAYAADKRFVLPVDYRLKVGQEGIVGLVARQGRPHLAANVKVNPYYLPHPHRPETQAEMAFPLIVRGEVIGVLDVQSREIVNLKNEEIAALQTMADQLANAIHNAQQYEELKRARLLVNARTGLAWLGMANSVWRHATDKHALTIREQTQLLGRHLRQLNLSEQKIVNRLAMIERLATKILEKPLTLPLTAEEGLEPVALNELISERARQLWQNDPYRVVELALELQLPGEVVVNASPEWLRRAFDILVDNAVNAVAEREIQQVIVGSRQIQEGAEIFVADTGPGLPENIREKIGLEFIEKSEDARGMGMGLLMAQTIVQTYGGEIRVEATGPDGTVMVIWLPIKA